MPDSDARAGAAYMVVASFCFAIMAALVKVAAADVGAWAVVFVRSMIILVVARGVLWRRGVPLSFADHRTLLVRSTAGFVSMLTYYAAIERIPLPDAVTLQYTSPLFVALLSPWTGERVSRATAGWLVAGFLGVVCVMGPRGAPELGAGLAIASGALAAIAYHAVRALRREDPDAVVVHFAAVASLLSAPAGVALVLDPPDPQTGLALVGIGLSAAAGQIAMTRSYRTAPAAWVSGFGYSGVVFGVVLGATIFGEWPSWLQIVGACVIGAVGVGLARAGRP